MMQQFFQIFQKKIFLPKSRPDVFLARFLILWPVHALYFEGGFHFQETRGGYGSFYPKSIDWLLKRFCSSIWLEVEKCILFIWPISIDDDPLSGQSAFSVFNASTFLIDLVGTFRKYLLTSWKVKSQGLG